MRYRKLGSHGPEVSALGYGAMTLAPGLYDEVAAEEAEAALTAAVNAGITFIDTADIYGEDGYSERMIGRVLGARRAEIVLATKFGGNEGPDGLLVPGMGRREYVRGALEASLGRLATDYVDLYYLHRLDPTTPIEETVGALAELVAEGKIRHIGLSEVSATTLRRAHAVHPIAALQTEYSLLSRGPEDEVLPVCRELGVAFVAYSPLGRGLLGGSLRGVGDLGPRDWRRATPRFQPGNLDRNVSLADALAVLAADVGVTPAQLALAWVLRQDTFPIPGTRRAANVRANAAAAELTLDDEVFRRLEELIPRDAVAGEQGTDSYLANIDTGR
ncbi:aldo/keto reductase [Streptomyces litchfieldiae]|uniref:Aldo/keto reductase n=1 Tax=Streptomyces litchfieldiae TaxID=3075543 RepID=A0ABU2ML54_9ACTN|nr:aldo/keto reductase [Streptomyces sp. DSM 44938]MDT0342333.1 aldo/keto reductase [Streptomyces sp. DSM 44938]